MHYLAEAMSYSIGPAVKSQTAWDVIWNVYKDHWIVITFLILSGIGSTVGVIKQVFRK